MQWKSCYPLCLFNLCEFTLLSLELVEIGDFSSVWPAVEGQCINILIINTHMSKQLSKIPKTICTVVMNLFVLFYLTPSAWGGDGKENATPHKTGSLAGFHFAAHKHTDVRHECITDGKRRGGAWGWGLQLTDTQHNTFWVTLGYAVSTSASWELIILCPE